MAVTDWAASEADRDRRAAERAELESERDYLLGSLRGLEEERDAGDLSAEDYTALHDNYTARAAEVLRRLDALESAGPAPPGEGAVDMSPAQPVPDPAVAQGEAVERSGARRWLGRHRPWVIVVGLVVLGTGVGLVAAGATRARQSGQSVSGSVHLAPAQELQAAQTAMASGDDVTALKLYQAVLKVEPDQPQALAYAGWLLREAGDAQEDASMVTQGLVAEENAVADDPQYPDARYFLGVMLLDEAHDPAGAVTQFEAYLALKPSSRDAAAVKPILQRARAEAGVGTG
jgi:tetratricopeptide (TPR) repeat protein